MIREMLAKCLVGCRDAHELNLPGEEVMTNPATSRFRDLQGSAILALAHLIVGLLLFAGALFLYEGLGYKFRILGHPSLEPYGIPIGLLLLCLAVATARLWIFEWEQEDRGQRRGRTAAPPPPDVMPRLQFVPSSTAANENRAPSIGIPNQAATSKRYLCQHTLYAYDATSLIGLRTVVHNGAIESIDENGAVRIDLPNLDELRAAVAILLCLLPIKLLGRE